MLIFYLSLSLKILGVVPSGPKSLTPPTGQTSNNEDISKAPGTTPSQSPLPGRKLVSKRPGAIDNTPLVVTSSFKVQSLTGKGDNKELFLIKDKFSFSPVIVLIISVLLA